MNGKKMINFVLAVFAVGFVLVVAGYYTGKALVSREERAEATADVVDASADDRARADQ